MAIQNQCTLIQLVVVGLVACLVLINSCTLIYVQGRGNDVQIESKLKVDSSKARAPDDDDSIIDRMLQE